MRIMRKTRKKKRKKKEENIDIESEKNKDGIEFAAEFTYVPDMGILAFPIIISKYINCTLIKKKELELMIKENIKLYTQLKHLIKPSQEKDIFIPYHILAKFYLYLFSQNSNFYVNMNRELRERKFDNHRIFIYLIYNALNKGILKSYCQTNLYRG